LLHHLPPFWQELRAIVGGAQSIGYTVRVFGWRGLLKLDLREIDHGDNEGAQFQKATVVGSMGPTRYG